MRRLGAEDWGDLAVVLAVARAGSLSGGAAALKVNHATVSRRLRAFEDRLGARLFERLPGGVAPTEAGREAAEAAELMEKTVGALDRALSGQDRRVEGPLTLTAPPLFMLGPGAGMLARLAAEHPALRLVVAAENQMLNLHRREADIAIRWTDEPDESLFGLRLTPQRSAVFTTERTARAMEAALAAGALVENAPPLAWIASSVEPQAPAELRARFPGLVPSYTADDRLTAAALARAADALCRLPCYFGDADPGLRRAPGIAPRRSQDLWLLTHPDLRRVERVRTAMRSLAEQGKALRGLFMGSLSGDLSADDLDGPASKDAGRSETD